MLTTFLWPLPAKRQWFWCISCGNWAGRVAPSSTFHSSYCKTYWKRTFKAKCSVKQSSKKSPKQALKNTISNTVKKQTGGARFRQQRKTIRSRSKKSPRKNINQTKVGHFKTKSSKKKSV